MGAPKKAPPRAPTSVKEEAAPAGHGFDLDAFLHQDASLSGAVVGEMGLPSSTHLETSAGLPTLDSHQDEISTENWGLVVSQSGVGSMAGLSAPTGWSSQDPSAMDSAEADSDLSLQTEDPATKIELPPSEGLSLSLEASEANSEASLAFEVPSEFEAPPAFNPNADSPQPMKFATLEEVLAEIPESARSEESSSEETSAEAGTRVFSNSNEEESLPEIGLEKPSQKTGLFVAPVKAQESPYSLGGFGISASSPASPAMSGADTDTVRKYALLKEREALEREATNRALQSQIEQVRGKLSRSETERRRLTLALQDSETSRRSLEDARDQVKHHVQKAELHHQEELRALQLRLDNAQFQAAKAEKKLEEFRERVRSDIQKIRLRERELANRLELQKRDAEALLTVKDEKLLQQKREIDRLEYEFEVLKERLVEDTEKAEERMGRLTRALKAMKLAEGILSEIDEGVLPGATGPSKRSGRGEAA